jgi:N-acetylglucosaminyl-diphospho-decaprenol L-rhamnosyltransferase
VKLTIIIISWNTCELLKLCLASVARAAQPFLPGEVETIVVDNYSHDGSTTMVRQEFPWVRLIENIENIGFARANNQAIQASTGRYVLLLNPDTVVQPDALHTMVQFMEANPDVGVTGSRLLNPDGTLQPSCERFPALTRELWRLFHLEKFYSYAAYKMETWSVNAPREVDVVQGACFLVERQVLEQVGLLDTDYFIYSEEVDLCRRIWRSGRQIWWLPQAQVIHYGGQSTQQVAGAMFLQLYKNKTLYFRKNHGWVAAQIYKLILLAAATSRLALSPVAWLEKTPKREKHLALAGNYRQLVRSLVSF